jgi:hypothetical protein
MAKETNPKNTALESDVLKAAGNAAGPVNQQAIKDQATADQGQAIPGKTETMAGDPGPEVQLPGSDLPPVVSTQAAGAVDPQYAEFLAWKKQQADSQHALAQASADLETKQATDYDARKQAAEEAARKAYNDIMDSQAQPGAAIVDQSKNADATSLHEQRLKMYGEGYVVARRLNVEQVFTRTAWNLLGGRSNKEGYREVVSAPPEVANMSKAQ